MSPDELARLFPNHSQSFIEANRETSSPKSEQAACNELLCEVQRETSHRPRYAVRIVSFRYRLIDADNLCGKFFVDVLRYAGILPDDTAAIMDYAISQQKVEAKDQERTEITITEL